MMREHPQIQTVEAEVDPRGRVRLLGAITMSQPTRILVVLFGDPSGPAEKDSYQTVEAAISQEGDVSLRGEFDLREPCRAQVVLFGSPDAVHGNADSIVDRLQCSLRQRRRAKALEDGPRWYHFGPTPGVSESSRYQAPFWSAVRWSVGCFLFTLTQFDLANNGRLTACGLGVFWGWVLVCMIRRPWNPTQVDLGLISGGVPFMVILFHVLTRYSWYLRGLE